MEHENGYIEVPYMELSCTDQCTVHEVFGYLATEAANNDMRYEVEDIESNMSKRQHVLWCLPGHQIECLFNHDTGRGQYGEMNINPISLHIYPPKTAEQLAELGREDPEVFAFPAWAVLYYRANEKLIDTAFAPPHSNTASDAVRLDHGKLVRALENPGAELFTPMEDNFTDYPMPELTSDELNIIYRFNEVYREVAVRVLEAIKKETVDRMKAMHEYTDSTEFLDDYFRDFIVVKDALTGSIIDIRN